MKLNICIVLIFLLLICFFDLPYDYFKFVRVIAFLGFGFLAIKEGLHSLNSVFLILFITASVVFNPFFKFFLGRNLWLFADVFFSAVLILFMRREKLLLKNKKNT